MGYCGVSPKTCKGLYKSILNRARCLQWNPAEGLPDTLDGGVQDRKSFRMSA
jgi:hypothetical protein